MDNQVEEIKAKSDIVQIIGERIQLKKAGRNYKANCPFHNEKSPSFMVSSELQIFKCFGCSESGDVISFLEKYEGMEFYEALKYLADRAGIKLKPREGNEVFSEKDNLFEINSLISQFYQYMLLKHESGKKALDYLIKDRGLKLETIKEFKIGFSPDVQFALRSYLVNRKKVSLSDLEKTGVVYLKEGRAFDRFRGRVIFPLCDHRGNVVGFSGRILPWVKTEMGKYINTPETAVYHKSKVLYGLNLTKQQIKQQGEAVVVEGELDMISSWQAGINNVVAIKGSAFTTDQTELLRRFTEHIVLALDADFAGDKAARRGIEIAETAGLKVSVAILKDYKDPDEAARDNPEKLKMFIKNSIGIWDFIIDSIFNRYGIDEKGETKAKISQEVVPVLVGIKDSIVQAHYSSLVAQRLNVPVEAVFSELQKHKTNQLINAPVTIAVEKKQKVKTRHEILEERLLYLLLNSGELISDDDLALIKNPVYRKIADYYQKQLSQDPNYDPLTLVKKLPAELSQVFNDLVFNKGQDMEDQTNDDLKRELSLVFRELKIFETKTEIDRILMLISTLDDEKDKEQLNEAKKAFTDLSQTLKNLEAYEKKGIIL
jgi:DNA primase